MTAEEKGEKSNEEGPVALSPEDAAITASFVQRYELAIKNWLTVYPNTQLPITYHPVTGLPQWVNRAERKRIAKLLKKSR